MTKASFFVLAGRICALLTALGIAYGSFWMLVFYYGFVFNPPGSANDDVLERIWSRETESRLKKISFRRIEITKKQTLQAFDKLISTRRNFRPDASQKPFSKVASDNWVRFEFVDGATWTSYYVTWTEEGFLMTIRTFLPSMPSFFESGYNETFLPFPPEAKKDMDLILSFLNLTQSRYVFPRLVIEDDGYAIYFERGIYLSKRTFSSIDELKKIIEEGGR